MPPSRSLLLLRPHAVRIAPLRPAVYAIPRRPYSSGSSTPPPPDPPKGPTQDALPHVTEEAAATAKILGETPPEIEQGTPISEVISRDPEAQKKAPKVLKPDGRREYSTLVSASEPIPPTPVDEVTIHAGLPHGAKFPLPDLPLPPTARLKHRYPPIVETVTNLIMKDGKKAFAQSTVDQVLAILRTKGPPVSNPRTPIVPSAPPLASLPADPVAYLQVAIDSIAPLLRIRSMKGSGGFRLQVPVPLTLKQRRRKAILWIVEAADKKKGRLGLAERLADEIVAVVEGRSSAWEKRMQLHRTGVAGRANVGVKSSGRASF